MEKPRPCGCKGIRSCLICEKDFGIPKSDYILAEGTKSFVFCPWCNKAWQGWDFDIWKKHPNHEGESFDFPGVYIQCEFISHEEGEYLLKRIDEMMWDPSQSGRRKQNFGPKCNFRKQRIRLGDFKGFPSFTKFIQERFKDVPILKNFNTVEQCSLEYDPVRGASIDPHIDDCWVWGERVVTVNLLSDCTLTMTRYGSDTDKYNLKCCSSYPRILSDDGALISEQLLDGKTSNSKRGGTVSEVCQVTSSRTNEEMHWPVVRIPMPAGSLIVIYGAARYDWEHCVLREDVKERRVCLAYREFTPPYLEGGKHADVGQEILRLAENFWHHLSTPHI